MIISRAWSGCVGGWCAVLARASGMHECAVVGVNVSMQSSAIVDLCWIKTQSSTYDGDGNRQKGASIFFSDKFWVENECLWRSDHH